MTLLKISFNIRFQTFRVYRESVEPDIIMKFDYTSQSGGSHKIDIPLGIDFFFARVIELFTKNYSICFLYYGNGFNHNELYNISIPLRRFYFQKLIDLQKIKNQNKLMKSETKERLKISRPTFQKS